MVSARDAEVWARRVGREGQAFSAGGAGYRVLRSEAGAELWAPVTPAGRVLALHPHFAAASRCPLRLTDRLFGARESPDEGGFGGEVLAAIPNDPAAMGRLVREFEDVALEYLLRDADAATVKRAKRHPQQVLKNLLRKADVATWETLERLTGDVLPFNIVFDVPDWRLRANLSLPAVTEAQIVAFAQECDWYPDEVALSAAQEGEPAAFGSESFVMYDVFERADRMRALAAFSGEVLDTAVRVNELTGVGFRWARVRTLVGELEVVAAPALGSGKPVTGGLVLGVFWLSGRITVVHAETGPRESRFRFG